MQKIKDEIEKTDGQIDAAVYKIYGLTAEEIKIVEGKDYMKVYILKIKEYKPLAPSIIHEFIIKMPELEKLSNLHNKICAELKVNNNQNFSFFKNGKKLLNDPLFKNFTAGKGDEFSYIIDSSDITYDVTVEDEIFV